MFSKIKVRVSSDQIQMIKSNPSFIAAMWDSLIMASRAGKIVSMGLSPVEQSFEILLEGFSIPFTLVQGLSKGVFNGCQIEVFVKTSRKIGYIQMVGDGGEYSWFCDKSSLNERNIVAIGFDALAETSGEIQSLLIPRCGGEGNAIFFLAHPGNLQFDLIRESVSKCVEFEADGSTDFGLELEQMDTNPDSAHPFLKAA